MFESELVHWSHTSERESDFCVKVGSSDTQLAKCIWQQVVGVEPDDTAHEEFVAQLDDDLVAILECALRCFDLVLVAAQEHADEGVGNRFADRPGGDDAAQTQHGAQQHQPQHSIRRPNDLVGPRGHDGGWVQRAELVVQPSTDQNARRHRSRHRGVAPAIGLFKFSTLFLLLRESRSPGRRPFVRSRIVNDHKYRYGNHEYWRIRCR